MQYVILGFLLLRNLTQYDLMKALQSKVSPFYQASLGSIQSALKKLQSNGYITLEKVIQNGKRKNIYTISESGKTYFLNWMLVELSETKFEAEISIKLFFLGLLSEDDRKQVVKQIVDFLEALVTEYEESEKQYKQREYKKEYEDVVKYQFKTLYLGIFHYKNTLLWFKQLLNEMEEE